MGLLILYWIEVVRRAPFSCSDLRGKAFRFASLSIVLDVQLSYMVFFMSRVLPSILNWLRIIIIKGCRILTDGFFCICWGDVMIFILSSVNAVYTIYWALYDEPSLHPRGASHMISMRVLWMCCWIWFANIFVNTCMYIY